jgi:hypothetical protein
MKLNSRLAGSFLTVALAFVSPAKASADEPMTNSEPTRSGRPSFVPLSGTIAWDTIVWVERRYKIEALRFMARDESGIDLWPLSDEVTVGTFDANGFTVSREIGNVDTGDVHNFDPAKSCIIPIPPGSVVLGESSVCDPVGAAAPLSFKVELWDDDDGGLLVDFDPGVLTPELGKHGSPLLLHYDADDLLGRLQIDLTAHDLDKVLLNVGDVYDETVALHPCLTDLCGVGPLDPDYTFTYRITRLPDMQVDLRSVVNDAMQRSSAGSELEAIVAGLRALRAPSSRHIEPETRKTEPTR